MVPELHGCWIPRLVFSSKDLQQKINKAQISLEILNLLRYMLNIFQEVENIAARAQRHRVLGSMRFYICWWIACLYSMIMSHLKKYAALFHLFVFFCSKIDLHIHPIWLHFSFEKQSWCDSTKDWCSLAINFADMAVKIDIEVIHAWNWYHASQNNFHEHYFFTEKKR